MCPKCLEQQQENATERYRASRQNTAMSAAERRDGFCLRVADHGRGHEGADNLQQWHLACSIERALRRSTTRSLYAFTNAERASCLLVGNGFS